jgi:hypothetical protein
VTETAPALSTRRAQLLIAARRPRVGRIERLVRRSLVAAGKPLTTIELARRIYRTTQLKHWHSYNVRRAAPKFAVRVGVRRSRGVPILWAAD